MSLFINLKCQSDNRKVFVNRSCRYRNFCRICPNFEEVWNEDSRAESTFGNVKAATVHSQWSYRVLPITASPSGDHLEKCLTICHCLTCRVTWLVKVIEVQESSRSGSVSLLWLVHSPSGEHHWEVSKLISHDILAMSFLRLLLAAAWPALDWPLKQHDYSFLFIPSASAQWIILHDIRTLCLCWWLKFMLYIRKQSSNMLQKSTSG